MTSESTGRVALAPSASGMRMRGARLVARVLRRPELGALSGAILIYVVFYVLAGSSGMFTVEGILQVAAEIGIIAAAAALLMIAGEFDLSIGSMIGFASITIGLLTTVYDVPLALAITIALVVCGAIGAANGWLTVKTGLPSFIVTLASMLVLRGLAIAVTRYINGYTQISGIRSGDPDSFMVSLFGGRVGAPIFVWMAEHGWISTKANGLPSIEGLPVSILWWVGLTALATWILLRTRFGNWIFAVGGDANSARNAGVPVHRVKIIAVVIGGTLLTGGYGSAVGAFLGALIYGTVQIGILYTGVDSDLFKVFLGMMVLLAVLFNNYVRRRATLAR
jgi:simple sugar transport system permease protein